MHNIYIYNLIPCDSFLFMILYLPVEMLFNPFLFSIVYTIFTLIAQVHRSFVHVNINVLSSVLCYILLFHIK